MMVYQNKMIIDTPSFPTVDIFYIIAYRIIFSTSTVPSGYVARRIIKPVPVIAEMRWPEILKYSTLTGCDRFMAGLLMPAVVMRAVPVLCILQSETSAAL